LILSIVCQLLTLAFIFLTTFKQNATMPEARSSSLAIITNLGACVGILIPIAVWGGIHSQIRAYYLSIRGDSLLGFSFNLMVVGFLLSVITLILLIADKWRGKYWCLEEEEDEEL